MESGKNKESHLRDVIRQSPKMQQLRVMRRKRLRRAVIIILAVLFVFSVGLVFASRIKSIQIKSVSFKGNQIEDTEALQAKMEEYLSGNYFYFIPKHNSIIFPKAEIEARLAEDFPRLRDIDISRNSLDAITVSLREERGTALWCGNELDVNTNRDCYFTDDTGSLVSLAPEYSGSVYLRFFGSDKLDPSKNVLGQKFIDTEKYKKLTDFEKKTKDLGLPIWAVVTSAGNDSKLILDTPGKEAVVRFEDNSDYEKIADNLKTAMKNPDFSEKLKKQKNDLEYIDLRFSNKVYYKFKGEALGN